MSDETVERTGIDSGWRFRECGSRGTSSASDLPWMPAQVPGHVHLDLMRNGVISNPFVRMQERACAWVDEADWEYETTFIAPEKRSGRASLLFRGLDTVAEIALNGEILGHTDNMFVPHEFDVTDRLLYGKSNVLRIVFRSALRVGRERRQAWADEGNDTMSPEWFLWGPRSFVRKAQYMYGWDWGPELVSCGVWRGVELVQTPPAARIVDWRYDVELQELDLATVRVEAWIERPNDMPGTDLTLSARLRSYISEALEQVEPGQQPVPSGAGRHRVALAVSVKSPLLWWPNGMAAGHGSPHADRSDPHLYELELMLAGESIEDSVEAQIGLRTIELIQELDGEGSSFLFRVNGRDLFIKGANWIPADSFPARFDPDGLFPVGWDEDDDWPGRWKEHDTRVDHLILSAAAAGFNMLRVWGGGIYETEEFYRACDNAGILVWQDFPYGCAYYPDTGDYAEASRREAVSEVRRIRKHPSLALWCGNNENDTMHRDGWAGKSRPARYLGEKLYYEILPGLVQEEDPGRPYWPSSPAGGPSPNSEVAGDRHDWDVWHGVGDWTNYRVDRSRFVSEFGFASSCGLAAWDSCLAPSDRSADSPAVRWHDKTRKGYETYLDLVRLHFPSPLTLEDLVYYTQINQAEAMKCGLEHWRQLKGRSWGLLIWQLNDCWPVQSWSLIDSAGEPKAAYYAVGRAYAPVLLSLTREGLQISAHIVNDLPTPISGTLHCGICTAEGEALAKQETAVTVGENGVSVAAPFDCTAAQGRERTVFLDARLSLDPDSEKSLALAGAATDSAFYQTGLSDLLLFVEPKDLSLANPGLQVAIEDLDADRWKVTLSARRLAPFTWLRVDGAEGWSGVAWSDNFVHVRPGRPYVLVVEKSVDVNQSEDLRGRLRVRSL